MIRDDNDDDDDSSSVVMHVFEGDDDMINCFHLTHA